MSSSPDQNQQDVTSIPPIDPDTAQEWHRRLQWWENQANGAAAIRASNQELTRAQQLLEQLVRAFPRPEFWRSLSDSDLKCALIAAMAQNRGINPASGVQEPNRKILPPFDVCLKILNNAAMREDHLLVYSILQNGDYILNSSQRDELGKHFTAAMREGALSPLATQTMERLNFR